MDLSADVIVVGGGVSGLTAAAELAAGGAAVILVEARKRLGGRVWTHRFGAEPAAVAELGAEFVHGGSSALRELLHAGRVRTRAADSSLWWWSGGTLERLADFWERVGRVADQIPARSRGWSFDDFLAHRGDRIDPADRDQARHYVQSFNAAPAGRLAAQPLRENRAGADEDDLFVVNGYDRVVRALERRCRKAGVDLRPGTTVARLAWRRRHVVVTCSATGKRSRATFGLSARAAVVTVPLGVLRAGGVRFVPALTEKAACVRTMGWGHVSRLTLRFRETVWAESWLPEPLRAARGRGFGFVNAPQLPLPVWWAPKPPQPLLVGWAGGPAAQRLARLGPAGLRRAAVESLARLAGVPQSRVRRDLLESITHDWSADPFSRGAYSFVAAGAEAGPQELGRPVGDTLFFAGEATADDPGTVHGAIASGLRAAREVSRAG